MNMPLLTVENLQLSFADERVIKGISFNIYKGETFALVGESGSGKSLAALSVIRLHPLSQHCRQIAYSLPRLIYCVRLKLIYVPFVGSESP